MARDFNVQGTREYLYWAIGLAVLVLWCAKDGWFPSEKIVNKVNQENKQHYGFTIDELNTTYGVPLPGGWSAETAGEAAKKRYAPPANIIFDMDNKNNFWRFNRSVAILCSLASVVLFIIHRAVN